MDELAQLKQQVEALTKQVQGVAAERNELKQKLQQAEQGRAPMTASPGGYSSHPFAGVFEDPSVADTWLKSQVNALFEQQGFVSQHQLNQLIQQSQTQTSQQFDAAINQYIRLYHGLQETLGQQDYAGLKKWDDPLAKKTREIAEAQGWAKFAPEAKDWLSGTYNDVQGLSKAARMARAEMAIEEKTQAESQAKAQEVQNAAQLGASPATGSTPAGSSKPDFASLGTTEEVLNALDQATPVGASR